MNVTTPTSAPRPAPLDGVGRAVVVGSGVSGLAAAALLERAGVAVVLVDRDARRPDGLDRLGPGVDVRLGGDAVDALSDDVDLVVPSPGVPEHAPVLTAAADRGVPIWSEPELALRVHPRPLVALTGTNGKTSTTELTAAIVAASGRPAVTCGNIGRPLSDAVGMVDDDTLLVAELSSFQLRFAGSLRPSVGALLNLAPDHLDWHGDERAYHAAKARLWEAQHEDDWAVANADDAVTLALRDTWAPGRRADFSGTRPVTTGVGVEDGHLVGRTPHAPPAPLLDLRAMPSPLPPHRVANAAAAATIALLAGVPAEVIGDAVRAYQPGRHRFELVATSRSGIRFIDDSKATNPHAAAAALRGAGPCVWIAGGRSKGVDLGVLGGELGDVRAAVLIGEAAHELAATCEQHGVSAEHADGLEAAVERAAALASPGETVLLSPACASFDQFRDYAERGERFAAAARAVAGERSRGEEGTP